MVKLKLALVVDLKENEISAGMEEILEQEMP
jgi:hypothetical protein